MYLLYSVLLTVYCLAALPRAAYAAWRRGTPLGGLSERLGRLPAAVNPDRRASIWIHAVSVGEALAARPLLRAVRAAYPDHRLVLSTTTVTGQRVARGFGDEVDAVFYAPLDFAPCVVRTLDRIAPDLLAVVDTELWPNLLRVCRRRGVRTLMVNGRLSDRSYRGYRLARGFMRRVLADVERVCVQTGTWGRRFVAIGAPPGRVTVTGSLKFDAAGAPPAGSRRDAGAAAGPEPARGAAAGPEADAGTGPGREAVPTTAAPAGDLLLAAFDFARERPVLIAASTLRGEEEPVLRAFARVRRTAPDALLVIAPRHPERFGEALETAGGAGYRAVMRSALEPRGRPDAEVVILDTLGELGRLFAIASAVFVGGSLVPAGGHNLIEPAAAGRAIVVGPHMENFAEVVQMFITNGAAVQVRDARGLEETLADLMGDGERRSRLGDAARAIVEANRGATRRTLAVMAELLPPAAGVPGASVAGRVAGEAAAC